MTTKNYSNKKLISLLLGLMMAVSVLTACESPSKTDTEPKYSVNSAFSETGLVTLLGEPFSPDEGEVLEDFGFGYTFTPQMQQLLSDMRLRNYYRPNNGMVISFVAEKAVFAMSLGRGEKTENEDDQPVLTNEELMDIVNSGTMALAGVFRITADEDGKENEQYMNEVFKNTVPIGIIGSDQYYFAYNDDFSDKDLNDEDKALLSAVEQELPWLMENLCLFPAKVIPEANMNSFSAMTIDGGSFTEADLAGYELTMVNIWTTWCNPCVAEMPDLQKLYEKLPAGVNLISICEDAEDEMKLATEIVEQTGIQYAALIPDKALGDSLVDNINVFPTTIFVDSSGNLVGKEIRGVPQGDDVSEAYLELIGEMLKAVRGQ